MKCNGLGWSLDTFFHLRRHFFKPAALRPSSAFRDLLTLLHVSEGRPYGTFPETQRPRCLRRVRFRERGPAGSVLRFSDFDCKTIDRRGVWGGLEFKHRSGDKPSGVFLPDPSRDLAIIKIYAALAFSTADAL